MQTRTLALAGGAIVLAGAALAGGYYFGRNQPPTPAPAAQTPAPNNYAGQQALPPEAPSEQSSAMPQGYESAQFSAAPRFGSARQRTHRHIDHAYFRDQLAPYGRWEHSDRWGEVWQPSYVEADFRPYSRGHWVNTREFGWTWDSDYEWGAIPFHYGRWVDDPDHGWLWIPGYVWGPGWVVWRSGGHYTGWMPMPPDREFLRGDETYRNDWREETDYGYRDWYGPRYDENRTASLWVFVDTGHIADRDYRPYEISRTEDVRAAISQTSNVTNYTTVNNFVVNQSIDTRAVEQASGRRVETVSASIVVKRPELVTSVESGRQVQIQARQETPTGFGKPNSAPPPAQVPLGAPSTSAALNGDQQPFARHGNAASGNAPPAPAGAVNPPPASATGQSNLSANPAIGEGHKHRFEREQGFPSAAVQNGQGATSVPNAESVKQRSAAGGAAANGAPPIGEGHKHRFEREQGLPSVAAQNGQGATGAPNGESMKQQNAARGAATSSAPPVTQPQAQTGMAPAPFDRNRTATQAGPAASAVEDRRHHHLERQLPPSGETATGALNAGPSNDQGTPPAANAPAAANEAAGNGELRRHGRRQPEQNATTAPNSGAPTTASGPEKALEGQSSDKANGFPRGTPENSARAVSPETGQSEAPGPSEQPHKKKLIVPASVEPSANAHKNAQAAPGTDARTESPPPPDSGGNAETPKEHKGRHKSDEPGAENAPP